MISGAGIAPAPAVAPSATAPSFSCSTSSGAIHCKPEVARRCSGDLLEKGRFTTKGTDHRQLQRLAKQLPRNPSHVFGGNGIDLRDRFVDILDFSGQRLLATVPGRHRVRALHLEKQASLVELLGFRQLGGVDWLVAKATQLADDGTDRARRLARLGTGVDPQD